MWLPPPPPPPCQDYSGAPLSVEHKILAPPAPPPPPLAPMGPPPPPAMEGMETGFGLRRTEKATVKRGESVKKRETKGDLLLSIRQGMTTCFYLSDKV